MLYHFLVQYDYYYAT